MRPFLFLSTLGIACAAFGQDMIPSEPPILPNSPVPIYAPQSELPDAPEPATVIALAAGLAAVVLRRKRR